MIDLVLASAATFLVTIDPVGNVPFFLALTPSDDDAHRRAMAIKGTALAAAILLLFAFLGDPLLRALGISLPAFRIAGGLLLFLLAIDMVLARQSGLRSTTASENEEARAKEDISVFPLAIPFIAGPGALTSVVLLAGRAEGDWPALLAVVGTLLAVLAATLALLLGAARVSRLLGVTGANVVSRVFGVLLAALAVQYVVDGARQALTS